MSASVRTGSLGENIRNDIAWRNEWQKLWEEAEKYLQDSTEAKVEFAYSTKLKQESVDYNTGLVTFSVAAEWRAIKMPPTLKMLIDLDKGLKATKRAKAWGMGNIFLPGGYIGSDYFRHTLRNYFRRDYTVTVALYNDKGIRVSTVSTEEITTSLIEGDFGYRIALKETDRQVYPKNKKIKVKMIFSVKADDITDNMALKIIRVWEINQFIHKSRDATDIIPISTY
jgi:hypothetical protein